MVTEPMFNLPELQRNLDELVPRPPSQSPFRASSASSPGSPFFVYRTSKKNTTIDLAPAAPTSCLQVTLRRIEDAAQPP